jgi:peptidoglycan/xylan/chitin deacetylase (PgdA/CDA1 family)
VHSTFFIAPHPEKGDKDPPYTSDTQFYFADKKMTLAEWVRWLTREGWEIGLHGSIASATSEKRIILESELVRQLSGQEAIGNRQHHLYYQAGQTEKAHARADFLYDSSLGYNEILGFRNSSALPFYPRATNMQGRSRVLQIPLVLHDAAFFYQKYDYEEAVLASRRVIQEVKNSGGGGALLFHPGMTHESIWIRGFRVYQTLLSELSRDETVWLTTVGELSRWWHKRSARCGSLA